MTFGECVEWSAGSRYRNGYGKRYVRGSSPRKWGLAHRMAWEDAFGPIPPGLIVMHACDNRACVNLDHLRLGTPADNMADMHAKGRGRTRYERRTACVNGHAYAEHASFDRHGWPHCRVCDAARHREARRAV